jgi:hypothetical protein
MQFEYQAFTIECSVRLVGEAYFGQATIYSLPSGKDSVECFRTDLLPSCSTQIRAIGHARNFAEMWCDCHIV